MADIPASYSKPRTTNASWSPLATKQSAAVAWLGVSGPDGARIVSRKLRVNVWTVLSNDVWSIQRTQRKSDSMGRPPKTRPETRDALDNRLQAQRHRAEATRARSAARPSWNVSMQSIMGNQAGNKRILVKISATRPMGWSLL